MTHTAHSAHRPRLLVVDDQPINIQTLFEIFEADHDVFMATSGEQALAFALGQPPDLILLDVVMPGLDGHQVCRQLKADARTRDIPVIFVTANNDPQHETKGLSLGAVDFISKPVNAAVVRARVRSHLLLRRALEDVQLLNEYLEQKVLQRTSDLESALQLLSESQDSLARSEAKAAIGMLVASVSHELATPLGNGLMAASALKQQTIDFQPRSTRGHCAAPNWRSFWRAWPRGPSWSTPTSTALPSCWGISNRCRPTRPANSAVRSICTSW
jgi:CheY-like chemotaxis protein